MDGQPDLSAMSMSFWGSMRRGSILSGWAISQFWQKGQSIVQCQNPTEKVRLPGRKRRKGFFSTGSRAIEDINP
jgi:hypothetical protein